MITETNETTQPYTKTINEESKHVEVTGPGLVKPRWYPTEHVANEAITLFKAIYEAGRLSR